MSGVDSPERDSVDSTSPAGGESRQADAESAQEPSESGAGVGFGLALLAGAAVLFGICSLIQGAFGSSMFATRYRDPGLLGSLLVNLTFYPGWFGTILLAGYGLLVIYVSVSKK